MRLIYFILLLIFIGCTKEQHPTAKANYKPDVGILRCYSLRTELLPDAPADGDWTVISVPTGSTIGQSLMTSDDPCIQADSTGLYVYEYELCNTGCPSVNCCSQQQTCYYQLDLGEIVVQDFEVCDTLSVFIPIDSFLVADLGLNADYTYTGQITGDETATFDPSIGEGVYDFTFTLMPTTPTETCNGLAIPLDPDCVPIDYDFQITVILCCPEDGVIIEGMTGECIETI